MPPHGWAPRFALVLLLALAGCVADATEPGVAASAIVGGSPAEGPSTVRVGGQGSCMGTLVAPDVVLTAKHCVATFRGGGPFTCDENGELVVDPDAPVVYVGAGEFDEVLPAETFVVGPNFPSASRGVEVLVSAGDTICASDTALIVLDRAVDDGVVAPLRLDAPVALGEELTVLGQGQHEGGDQSDVLLGRIVTVTAIGPEAAVPEVSEATAVGFFSTSEGPCRGDSGTGALASSGAVVGVASSVGRPDLDMPTGTAEDCVGSRASFESVATEAALVEEALATVGATPWREGEPDPRAGLAAFEEPCGEDRDCRSSVCVTHDDGERRCSRGCQTAACPVGYECRSADDRMRCVERPPPPLPGPPRFAAAGGSCAVAPTRPAAPLGAAALLASLLRRRRRRGPTSLRR